MKLRSIRQDLKLRLDVQLKHLELCMKWLRLFRLGRLKRGGRRVPALKKKVPFPPNLAPNKTYKSSGRRNSPVVWHSVLHHGHWRSSWTCHPTRDDPNDCRVRTKEIYPLRKPGVQCIGSIYVIIQKIGYFIGVFRMNFHINSIWFTGKGVPARHIPILAFCSWGKWWSACDFLDTLSSDKVAKKLRWSIPYYQLNQLCCYNQLHEAGGDL